MAFEWDDREEKQRSEAMWAEFLAQIPEEFMGDPEAFLAAFHAKKAKVEELQQYHDFYHQQYLPWMRSPEGQSYLAYLQSQQPIPEVPQASQRPPCEHERLTSMLDAGDVLEHGQRQLDDAERLLWSDAGEFEEDE